MSAKRVNSARVAHPPAATARMAPQTRLDLLGVQGLLAFEACDEACQRLARSADDLERSLLGLLQHVPDRPVHHFGRRLRPAGAARSNARETDAPRSR
jgi:hypothetical protein